MKNSTSLTLENIEKLLDEKLTPIKEEITSIKGEITQIKDVTENRIYKELKETRQEMKEGFAHIDDVTNAIVLDYNDHEDRIKRLEKITSTTNNN